eukprot:scaffold100919_cov19-Tisochrysis_lutea.AAC.1
MGALLTDPVRTPQARRGARLRTALLKAGRHRVSSRVDLCRKAATELSTSQTAKQSALEASVP